jgi:DNA-binding IclR family transcriptional regulator
MTAAEVVRDRREIIRDEHVARAQILAAVADGALTVPEIAEATGHPTAEVVFWVMGMRKYGYLTEIREATDEGYFRYRAVERRGL